MKTPNYSIGLYQITYQNGITQQKHLILQKKYQEYVDGHKSLHMMKETKKTQKKFKLQIEELTNRLHNNFGDSFFTTESPLGKAIKTGELCLPKHQGGCTNVIIEKI